MHCARANFELGNSLTIRARLLYRPEILCGIPLQNVRRGCLPKDPAQARFWLKKVGERQDQQLWDKWKDDAAELLRKLDQEE